MKQVLFTLFLAAQAFAVPQLINYQGQLTSPAGTPLDTTVAVTFRLYTVPFGGMAMWTETHSPVITSDGLFNVTLGSATPLPDIFSEVRWLGISVGNNSEMIPRQQITSVAHAYRVGTVDGALGGQIASLVSIVGELQVGDSNTIYQTNGVVVGSDNFMLGQNSSITGGADNVVEDFVFYGHIGGGSHNTVGGNNASIGGGLFNSVTADFAWVSGGVNNQAGGFASSINGGVNNYLAADSANIAGGVDNFIYLGGQGSVIGGGKGNSSEGNFGVISGGISNYDSGYASTIGGGSANLVYWDYATIGGGQDNTATGNYTTVAGGANNDALSQAATVSGGSGNIASGQDAAIGGGWNNTASGYRSVIPGGASNEASSNYCFAAGHNSHAIHSGSFVWGDGWGTNLTSTANDEFSVRASGGYRLFTNNTQTSGVTMAAGGNSWVVVSDSMKKRDIRLTDTKSVLDKLTALPIKDWEYQSEADGIEHIGPMAQDFWKSFELGSDSLGIATIDADGVLFAAVQELAKQNQRQSQEIFELKQLVAQLVNLGNK